MYNVFYLFSSLRFIGRGFVKFCILSFLFVLVIPLSGGFCTSYGFLGGEFVGSIPSNVAHSLHVFQIFCMLVTLVPIPREVGGCSDSGG